VQESLQGLGRFLDYGQLELSNNLAENVTHGITRKHSHPKIAILLIRQELNFYERPEPTLPALGDPGYGMKDLETFELGHSRLGIESGIRRGSCRVRSTHHAPGRFQPGAVRSQSLDVFS